MDKRRKFGTEVNCYFFLKYKEFQRHIRNRQIERTAKLLEKSPSNLKKHRSNDYKRFIVKTNITNNGEIAENFTSSEIISQLRDMNFYSIPGEGYIPTYTRTDFTNVLHDVFGFRTDFQIVTKKQM